MKSIVLILLLAIGVLNANGQEVCASPEAEELDLNSVTKCTIKPSKNSKDKKTRQIVVKVSARKRRVLKKKIASTINKLKTSEVSMSSASKELEDIKISEIKTENNIKVSKNNLKLLNSKLSKEEVKKAQKFALVDKIPLFKDCKSVKNDEKSDCFNMEMVKHISKHFNYPSEAIRSQIEGEVWVRFIIDKSGYVKNIKTLGPDNGEVLNEEAKRVVSKLPKFKPAKKDGKRISVKYGFPINFSLEE